MLSGGNVKLSAFGKKFTGHSGIVDLMGDLGRALDENPNMIFMGGGNPAYLPEVEQVFSQRLQHILTSAEETHALLGIYQSPQGDQQLLEQLADFFKRQYQWPITSANIAIANGSQSAFFVLFNMFAGIMSDGSKRHIHLPLSPEYLGYADCGLSTDIFTATRPSIELLDDRLFKYHIDFNKLHLSDNTGALCVSRPTNPTGNVLTDDEIAQLSQLAQKHDIPLIIDGAYGLPFPGIIFNQVEPHWDNNTILSLSLSKLGLPGVRTGIIIAREDIIQAFTTANTILNLACGNLGPAIAKSLFNDDSILHISQQQVEPFYRHSSQQTCQWFHDEMGGIPYRIHKPEGAIFLWLWLEGMPISSQELYQRLKKRGVLIVPGHNFFVGITNDWQHKHECIRVSYAGESSKVKAGVAIIADEVRKAYQKP